jgi:adenylosuccinate synthase
MKVSVVLGLGFGDEGKGLTTNWLCKDNDLVIRFNGGHQAGHTVVIGENRHVFSNFGSGTLKGAPTYWSKYCTIDPLGIMEEYKALKSIGANPVLYIDPYCPVVTPFDIASNRIKEKTKTHGSCGIGFGETVRRHESYFKLHALDLLFPSIFNASSITYFLINNVSYIS